MNVLHAGSEERGGKGGGRVEPGGYLSANKQRGLSGGLRCQAVVLLLHVG